MNQILSTQNNNGKKGNNGTIDIKKIIIFFVCAILIFGVSIAGVNIYKMYKRNKENNKISKPEITIENIDSGIRIIAKYDQGIDKLIYYWDEENKIETVVNGKTSIEKLIDLPEDESNLVVQLIGVDGKTEEGSQKFGEIGDSIIEISSVEEGDKLKIVVENAEGLKYITYKWNDEEETKISANQEGAKTIEATLDIDRLDIGRGRNQLTVKAIDSLNKQTKETKTIEGRFEPEIEFSQSGNVVECKVTHDMGFKKITFEVNGTTFIYDENAPTYNVENTTFICPIPLQAGENVIIVTAESLEGTTNSKGGKTTYNP